MTRVRRPLTLVPATAFARLQAMRALAITYERDAGPGVFAEAAAERDVELEPWRRREEPEPPRPVFEYDAVLVFGGAMHVDQADRHPWIEEDRRLLAGLLTAEKPLLGVCLGAQILNLAAGGEVFRLERPEIGWPEVELTPEGYADPLTAPLEPRFEALEWHSYGCGPAPGATVLARNDSALQAWRAGPAAWAIQFHAEVTLEDFEHWVADAKSDGETAGVDLEQLLEETRRRIAAWNELGRGLCGRFFDAIRA
jgi:GMP synthase (glutamine-hydrolysing)